MRILSRYSLIALLFTTMCIKPFEYESILYEKSIVVDGIFTDKKDIHKVTLRYTYPIDDDENKAAISGAEVTILEEGGPSLVLQETENGVYTTLDSVAGVPGKSYQLRFKLNDGEVFESIPAVLISSPPIDSIYDRYAELPSETKLRNEGGIQFFLDVHDDAGKSKYYRYEWEETYVIHVPYPSGFIYYEESDTWVARDYSQQVGTCYQSNYSNQLILGNSLGSSSNRLSEFPIRFVTGENETLRSKYSILVRQYVIDEKAYNYYRKLRESIESGGTLFDKQQGAVLGNVYSVDNPERTVLGYFEVSGGTELRTFFDYGNLDERLGLPRFKYPCTDPPFETTYDSVAYYFSRGYLIITDDFPLPLQMAPKTCADCSWYASTTKPDFWE